MKGHCGGSNQNRLRNYFRQRAPGYASRVSTYTDANLAMLCWEVLPRKNFQSILDLGAGQGHFSYLLSPHFPDKTIFFDISPEMLQEGVRRGLIPKDRIRVGDVNKGLPFSSKTFDLVLCRYAWHDFRHQERIAKEVARVLMSNGVFLFVDMCPYPEASSYVHLYNALHSLKTKLPTNIVTWERLLGMAKNAGLELLSKRWYVSEVALRNWVEEGQITEEESESIRRNIETRWEEFNRVVSIRVDSHTGDLLFSFPVVICSFLKPGGKK